MKNTPFFRLCPSLRKNYIYFMRRPHQKVLVKRIRGHGFPQIPKIATLSRRVGKGETDGQDGAIWLAGLVLLLVATGARERWALTRSRPIENCRASVGRAFVQAVHARRHGPRRLPRKGLKPMVRACVLKALNAANGRANVPVAVPKEQGPSAEIAKQAEALPTEFVAPPRTITDITAILDSEKPDPAKIAKLQSRGRRRRSRQGSPSELVRFYYDRGNARARLGRLREAMPTPRRPSRPGRGAVDPNLLGRLEQFAGIAIFCRRAIRKRRWRFSSANSVTPTPRAPRATCSAATGKISRILIQMGDLAQAEAYLQRNLELIQEARTSGMPGWRESYAGRGQSWEADVEHDRAIIFEARGQYPAGRESLPAGRTAARASMESLLKTAKTRRRCRSSCEPPIRWCSTPRAWRPSRAALPRRKPTRGARCWRG